MGKVAQQSGNGSDDEQRRRYYAQRSKNATGNTGLLTAYKRAGIYRDDTGGALTHSVIIQQILLGSPAFFLHDLPLEYGQHGIASAKGEQADPKEGTKQIHKQRQNKHFLSSDIHPGISTIKLYSSAAPLARRFFSATMPMGDVFWNCPKTKYTKP